MPARDRVIVIGAGIVGLAVARGLTTRGHQVVVLDKEDRVATHQTGRSTEAPMSGVTRSNTAVL